MLVSSHVKTGIFAVTQAQRYETLALKKYRCTLEIYYDFVLHGKIPPIDV